ncbi:MAG: peptidoglycan -binding protein [Methyloceanibacter sp.]|uniref:peptidoglycan -binding protein n=1 Tax=Methyloceanibacter sp. TaxID=1965321 RepID=UPI003D6C75C0
MALARARRRQYTPNYWPGFVDMLSTLLLVVIFLMALFMVTNYIITQAASGKDTMLSRLNRQLSELTELLALERSKGESAEDNLAALQATLMDKDKETQRLTGLLGEASGQTEGAEDRAAALGTKLDEQRKITDDALAKVELLNQQLAALRLQLAALNEALEASEAKDKESQAKIADLGQRLNVALARKVQELARYRSDFFGKLREALGTREDFQVVGDRFLFPSDVLFDTGSADLKPEALPQLDKLAAALKDIETKIPSDIAWVMRVDGHTDINPIVTPQFPSNWELSSARSISVVRYLMQQGISPEHLVAAGFGEFQPIDATTSDEALAKNRRIELKLTER